MNERNSAVIILTHQRADNCITVPTLRKCGYTGRIFLVIDNLDNQRVQYMENFGSENVIVFDKQEVAKRVDTLDNFKKMKAVVYARNEVFNIAKQLKLTHFVMLDDDYSSFNWRYEKDGKLVYNYVKQLDKVFDSYFDFLDRTTTKSICMYQMGDLIGGKGNPIISKKLIKRKIMNVFFCRTDRPFSFYGSINEDVNCYVLNGSRGDIYFSYGSAFVNQATTQKNSGGLTDIYLDLGTYVKSFYSVIVMPSAVKISTIGGCGGGVRHLRIHHNISWNHCVPKIISEDLKKK